LNKYSIFTKLIYKQPTYPLRLIMMNNACPNRITETSGTGFSQDFSKIISLFYFFTRFYSHTFLSPVEFFQVKLSLIAQNSPLQTPHRSLDLISVLMWLSYL